MDNTEENNTDEEERERDPVPHPLARMVSLFPLFQWKTFLLFSIAITLVVSFWMSTSLLFEIPPDVSRAYESFLQARKSYLMNPSYWSAKRLQLKSAIKKELEQSNNQNVIFLLQDAAPEVFLAIMADELGFDFQNSKTPSVFPKPTGSSFSLVISKLEQNVWPLTIVLSLEMEISYTEKGMSLLFTRLRRGSQELATGLTWAYFGSDVEKMKVFPLESIKASQGNEFLRRKAKSF